jgi:hypothetical protein
MKLHQRNFPGMRHGTSKKMREIKNSCSGTSEIISIDELNHNDIKKIEEIMGMRGHYTSNKCGVDDDYNMYFTCEWLADYHKGDYNYKKIIIVLPDVIKKVLYKIEQGAVNNLRREFKKILGL